MLEQARRLDRSGFQPLIDALALARRNKPTREVLAEHKRLIYNPNIPYESDFFGTGDFPIEPGKAYRNVRLSLIEDLARIGIVRNAETSFSTSGIPINGARVYWSAGKDSLVYPAYYRSISPLDAVLVVSRSVIEAGWVTIGDIEHIYVKPKDSPVFDLLGDGAVSQK